MANTDKKNILEMNQTLKASRGGYGGTPIVNTDTVTPDSGYVFSPIQCIEDTVIDEVVGNIDIDGLTFTDGAIIGGEYSSIKLTSGKVIAYQIPSS